MTLYQFCDRKFQNLSMELSDRETFSIYKEGQTKALLFLLNSQRVFSKWISVPKFLFLFLLTNLGLISPPADRLEELKARNTAAVENKLAAAEPPKTSNEPALIEEPPDAKVLSN